MPSQAGFFSGWNETGGDLIQQQGSQLQQALALADEVMKQRQQEHAEQYQEWSKGMAEARAKRNAEQDDITNQIHGMDLLMQGMKNFEHPGEAFAALEGLVKPEVLNSLKMRFHEGYAADQKKEWDAAHKGTQGGMAQAPQQPAQPGAAAPQSTVPSFISPNAQMQTTTNPFLGGAMGPDAGMGFMTPSSMPVPQAMPPTQDPFAGMPMGQDAGLGFGPNPQAEDVAPFLQGAPSPMGGASPQPGAQAPPMAPPVGPNTGMVPPGAAQGMPPGAPGATPPQGFVPPTMEDYLNSETEPHRMMRELREEQKRKAMAQERIAQMRAETYATIARATEERAQNDATRAAAMKQKADLDTEAFKARLGPYARSYASIQADLDLKKKTLDLLERHRKVMESIASRNAGTREGGLALRQSMANNPALRMAQQGYNQMDAAARDAQHDVEKLQVQADQARTRVAQMKSQIDTWQQMADTATDDATRMANQAKAHNGAVLVTQLENAADAARVRAETAASNAQAYRSMADGMRKDLYDKGLMNISDGKGVPTTPAPKITVPAKNLPVVTTQAQFDALPLGGYYRTMSGRVARKARMTTH